MTDQHRTIARMRVHVPIASDARTDDRRFERLIEAYPGVIGVTAAKDGRLIMIDYDPSKIGIVDLASIACCRSSGRRSGGLNAPRRRPVRARTARSRR